MISRLEASIHIPESSRRIQTSMNQYIRRKNNIVMNRGYIDSIKLNKNIRILSLNPRGINPWNDYKCEMLKQACVKYQIDIILLNETQVKCILKYIDKMLQRMKSIGREAAIFVADSE